MTQLVLFNETVSRGKKKLRAKMRTALNQEVTEICQVSKSTEPGCQRQQPTPTTFIILPLLSCPSLVLSKPTRLELQFGNTSSKAHF